MTAASAARPVKTPGSDHPIVIDKNPKQVVVKAAGKVIADTRNVLSLREASYPAVQYIPRRDVDMTQLTPTVHRTYCPYKGNCSYFTIAGTARGENAVWSYENPYPAVAPIKDYVAFYPDRVDAIEELTA